MKQKQLQNDIGEDGKVDDKESTDQGKSCTVRKCRYYDRGHCKYKLRCRYFHPRGICQAYFENGKCDRKNCMERHPKTCKYWLKSKGGCKRETTCDFMHVTLARDDGKVVDQEMDDHEYKCVGCHSSWTDRMCVVDHIVRNQKVYFCLNCDDWVRDKSRVLEERWSLFDDKGNLRYDV